MGAPRFNTDFRTFNKGFRMFVVLSWCLYGILWYDYGIIMVVRLHYYCICIRSLRYYDSTPLEHMFLSI